MFNTQKLHIMRKTMLSIALFVSAISANTYAQEAKAGDFNVGITAGGGAAFEWGSKFSGYDHKPIANMQAGVTFDYCFKDNIFMETGLLLERKGGKSIIENDVLDFVKTTIKTKSNLLYLEMPVTFNYRINAGKIGIIPQIGLYAAVGIAGNYTDEIHQEVNNQEFFNNNIPEPEDQDIEFDRPMKSPAFSEGRRNRFDGGARIGLGFAVSPKIKLSLGYDMGIFNTLYTRHVRVGYLRNQTAFGTITFYVK